MPLRGERLKSAFLIRSWCLFGSFSFSFVIPIIPHTLAQTASGMEQAFCAFWYLGVFYDHTDRKSGGFLRHCAALT